MMNRKLAVALLALPFGVSFLLAKPASAAEITYQPDAHTPIFVAQRYDDPQYRGRQDDWQRSQVRDQSFRRDELYHNYRDRDHDYHDHDSRGVWIPGHYKPGFLGLLNIWVDGHWERR